MEQITYTREIGLKECEKSLKKEANTILLCKQLGIRQTTLDKLIFMFSVKKGYYEKLKRMVEEDG